MTQIKRTWKLYNAEPDYSLSLEKLQVFRYEYGKKRDLVAELIARPGSVTGFNPKEENEAKEFARANGGKIWRVRNKGETVYLYVVKPTSGNEKLFEDPGLFVKGFTEGKMH